MNDTVRLGRILGVPVGLNWSLLAIVGLFAFGLSENLFPSTAPGYPHADYIAAGALTSVALLLGVLLHELGHAVVARRTGHEVEGITLSWMGGVTRIVGDSTTPGRELWVAGVGPLVSLAVGGALAGARELAIAAGSGQLLVASLGWLAVINVVLAAFNLIPASPLDGGRVLHALVWWLTRSRWRASLVASRAGVGFSVAVFGLGAYELVARNDHLNGLFVLVLGWWLFGSARAEEQQAVVHHVLDGVRVHEVMRPVGSGPGWLAADEFVARYVEGQPSAVWLLERWGGGYTGIVSGDALRAAPQPWGAFRPADVAIPVAAAGPTSPDETVLDAIERTGGRQVLLAVEAGRTVGAVLPADIDALVRSRRRPVLAAPLAAGVR